MEKPPLGTVAPADAPGAIALAAAVLDAGGLVGLPTETVYGLAADAASEAAVAKIFTAKGRPARNPLIVHVGELDRARRLVTFCDRAERLAEAFWPGPLTLVAPLRDRHGVATAVRAGHDTLALRMPAHPVARAVLGAFGGALAAPSANRSGRLSPTQALHVAEDMGDRVDLILDAGPCAAGLESTIVKLTEGEAPRILRPGATSAEAIARVVNLADQGPATDDLAPDAPGQLTSHYAPRARLRLNAREPRTGEAYLAFGPDAPEATHGRNLSETGNLDEAARGLFAALRALDAEGAEVIAVAPIPRRGLGAAIRDRLARAAAPRPDDA